MNKKVIPIGRSDFKEVKNDFYYIDKTLMIKDIIDNKIFVQLFTRPRRFGKTLNLSMIKYFFEKTDENHSYLFKDLKIWQSGEEYRKSQGKYPVISLTFKGAKMNNWDQTYSELIKIISEEYKRHDYLLNSINDKQDKDIYIQIKNGKAQFSDYTVSIKNLCQYLFRYYGKKPIILIDEYDVPLQNSYVCGFYNEAINFIRAMLQHALKDNQYLEFAIITGCLRISKESIFTGLNNLEVNSILDNQAAEYFGFLQSEVNEILKYYDLEESQDVVKDWYDGYKFGNIEIYNPWSILNYVKKALTDRKENAAMPYWANTSGNDIVHKLIKKANSNTKGELERLLAGESIVKNIYSNITYIDIDKNLDNIWNILFFTGYLTTAEPYVFSKINKLKIPNREIKTIYETEIKIWFNEIITSHPLADLFKAIKENRTSDLTEELNKILLQNISFYDSNESFYHGILIGIFSYMPNYQIASNQETGDGRSDIILEPIDDRQPAIIIEIKETKDVSKIDQKCQEALDQIEKKRYESYLNKRGYKNIIKYGICFFKKRCVVK